MPAIEYTITPKDLNSHRFEVALLIKNPNPDGQRIQLPSWIPGSYLIRDFSRQIESINAFSDSKNRSEIHLKRINNSTWEIPPMAGPVIVNITVYAFDTSVRTAYLDPERAFWNHSSLCLQVMGQGHMPCLVKINQTGPTKTWEVSTTLSKRDIIANGFGSYTAANYDELIDQPVALGKFTKIQWRSFGIKHQMVIQGLLTSIDKSRLQEDLKRICEGHISFFDPRSKRAPFKEYLFLVNTVGNGYGGLEHRSSTALLCNRSDLPMVKLKTGELPNQSDYENFLGLCSHEYFHSWIVKKVQPKSFQPYALDRKNFTDLLWLFEGFTSYYDDLQLFRTGCITREKYIKRILNNWNGVLRGSGRFKQSVADSSFDAWTKYYQTDENTPNAVVSYYAKGALIALALDIEIRNFSNHKKSLDDVMRALWKKHGAWGNQPGLGIDENAFAEVVTQITGEAFKSTWKNFSRNYIHGTKDIPIKELLASQHIVVQPKKISSLEEIKSTIGIRTINSEGWLKVTHVLDHGCAKTSGLAAGDLIASINQERVTPERWDKLLNNLNNTQIALTVFRHDVQIDLNMKLGGKMPLQYALSTEKQ
jgi:predicted metalloprotease with PDZ domain